MSRAVPVDAPAVRKRRSAETKSAGGSARKLPSSYLARAELPLASLVFVIPMILLYEWGTRNYATFGLYEQRILAFKIIQDFFSLFGAYGRYLPAMAVVGILLACHIARRDPWKVSGWTLGGMGLESVLMAVPLLLIGVVLSHYLPLGGSTWYAALGAGVYEELVFRLIGFNLLMLVIQDGLKMPKGRATLLVVVGSSALFAGYHYLGPESFSLRTFTFRTAAGVYLGALFLVRGFGVTAGAHAVYDILLEILP